MIHTKKLPRRLKEIKERMHVLSRPRLSGKVSAELTEGASVSRYEKQFLTKQQ